MKTHLLLFKTSAEILQEVFIKEIYADKVLDRTFKARKKLGSRDRRFVSDLVYESIRWMRKLCFALGFPDYQKLNPEDYFKVVSYQFYQAEKNLPDFLQNYSKEFAVADAQLLTCQQTAILGSAPDWLDQMGQEFFASEWLEILKSLNQMAGVDLRVNTLKTQKKLLMQKMLTAEIPVAEVPGLENALTLLERKNIFKNQLFLDGFFEVQDRASQLVAPLLDVKKGMTVIDACAGAGGKSLHVSVLLENSGTVFSFDVHQWKLDELKKRADRNGAKNIKTKLISESLAEEFKNKADRLLLDVPCSGSGTFRRQPDLKWKLKKSDLDQILKLQMHILNSYECMLKVGGILVYATCSFLPVENNLQIERWLNLPAQKGRWQKLKEIKILPHQGLGDGFYAVQLVKQST